MTHIPDFDELIGTNVPEEERERLRRAHELLIEAGPPPELSPGMETVPWPEEALAPLWGRRRPARSRPLVLAAAVLTAAAIGFVFGQATSSDSTAFNAKRIVTMKGTALDRDAAATLKLGARDTHGNWPMLLRVTGLQTLPESGYYRLYLTRGGKPLALCGSFSVSQGVVVVRFTASYDLKDFDKNGWVVTRQEPGHHEPTDIVLKTQA